MTRETAHDALEVLACDIELRPAAPGIDDVAPSVRSVVRDGPGTLAVSFDPAAARDVEAFVAAERQCCSSLTWTLETEARAVRLTIGATPQQIDLLEQLFTRSA